MRMSKRLIATVCMGFLLAACSPKSPESLSKEAQELREQGDLSAELITLKSAVEAFPDNAQLRLLLADSNFRTGNGAQAITEYENAFELDNSVINAEIMQRVLRVMYVQEMNNETFEFISKINRPQILPEQQVFYKAAAYHRLGQRDEAIELFETLYSDPGAMGSLAKAYVEILVGDPTKARGLLEDALFADSSLLEARFLFADLLYYNGEVGEASALFEQLIEYPVKSIYAQFMLGKSYLLLGQIDDAQELVAKLESEFPDISEILELNAEIEFDRENYTAAKLFADKALTDDYQSEDLLFVIGVSNYFLQTYEQALRPLRALPSSNYRYDQAQNFITVIELMLEGPKIDLSNTQVARRQINAAYELVKLGFARPSQQLLQVIDSESVNSDIKAYLLLLNHTLQPSEETFAAFKSTAMRDDTDVVTKLVLIESLIERKVADEEVLDTALQAFQQVDETIIINATAQFFVQQDNTQAALSLFDQAIALSGTSPVFLFEKATLLQQTGNVEGAAQLVIENKNVEGFEPLAQALAAILVNDGYDNPQLVEIIKDAYESGRQTSATATYYASIYADEPDVVISALEPFVGNKGLSKAFYFSLYRAYLRVGDLPKMLALTEDWIAELPSFEAFQYRLAALDFARDFEAVLRLLNRMERLYGKRAYIELMRVNYNLSINQVAQAKSRWAKLPPSLTLSAPGKEIEARIMLLEGNHQDAASTLIQLNEENPLGETAFGTLISALSAENKVDLLIQTLQARVELYPNNQKLRLVLIDLLMNQDIEQAVPHLTFLRQYMPESVSVMNNLAWAHYRSGNKSEALEASEALMKLDPEHPEALHTIGIIQGELGDKQLALEALERTVALTGSEQYKADLAALKAQM